ncbi:hypothetical protein ERH_0539 [Erysipelothrix rhusiopathiae str. Fujisawa]|nr:hypothetical protein ERH_0539 [Erysipelothrix rhusiopathiae str. Fujisawa]
MTVIYLPSNKKAEAHFSPDDSFIGNKLRSLFIYTFECVSYNETHFLLFTPQGGEFY